MKTRSVKIAVGLSVLGLGLGAAAPQASGQAPAGLGVQLYAGLTITGSVGTVYSIEYVTDLAQTNNASAWRCLEYLRLPASPYLWTDRSGPVLGRRFYRAVVFPAPTNLAFIPPGAFRMGSPTNEVGRSDFEGPQTSVTISRGFWIGKYEVTQGEFQAVTGSNPSYFNGNRTGPPYYDQDYGTNLSRPVENVSWNDATNYCARLTQLERTAGRIAANSAYRLPTEAEWEYACRAWTATRFSHGDDPGYRSLTNYAWYSDNSGSKTRRVGLKLPNPWGLYDIHGNVYEWCQDWFDYYVGGSAVDPQGPASGFYRVMRGGDWFASAGFCRSADRFFDAEPTHADSGLGFRVVLAPTRP